jgi:hypothetical protein
VAPLANGDQLATGEALTATRARNEGPSRRLERVASWRFVLVSTVGASFPVGWAPGCVRTYGVS